MEIHLKVAPDELKDKAGEITRQIQAMEKNWNGLREIVNGSQAYWEGNAGDQHRKLVRDNEDDVQTLLKRLKEHPRDLLEMAGIYIRTEEKAVQTAATLPGDIIR